jgi:CBS domain-containing protein
MLRSEIMTRAVVSLRPGDKIDAAARRMRDENAFYPAPARASRRKRRRPRPAGLPCEVAAL